MRRQILQVIIGHDSTHGYRQYVLQKTIELMANYTLGKFERDVLTEKRDEFMAAFKGSPSTATKGCGSGAEAAASSSETPVASKRAAAASSSGEKAPKALKKANASPGDDKAAAAKGNDSDSFELDEEDWLQYLEELRTKGDNSKINF